MVKLTPDNLAAKLKKRIDLNNTEELNLSGLQIDDLGSFASMPKLNKVDLSNNRIQFFRQLEKFLETPTIKELTLTGNPVCKITNYRYFIIKNLPDLEILDGKEVTPEDRESAVTAFEEKPKVNLTAEEAEKKRKEDELRIRKMREAREAEKATKEREEKGIAPKVQTEEERRAEIEEEERLQKLAQDREAARDKAKREAEIRYVEEQRLLKEAEEKRQAEIKAQAREIKQADSTRVPTQPTVFEDKRSGLTISDKLSSGVNLKVEEEPAKVEETPQRNILDDESLFGKKNYKPTTQSVNISIDDSFDDDDFLKTLEKKTFTKSSPKPKPVSLFADDDDLFGTSSKKKTNIDDDLFSLVDNKKTSDSGAIDPFSIDSYIAKNTASKKSSSLFDD